LSKGNAFRYTITAATTNVLLVTSLNATPFTATTVTSGTGYAIISAPAGGMGQFKGLGTTGNEPKYV